MSMDFYRRPQLAGTALRFPDYPMLRGSVHRHDPDGVSSAPYFPLATGGDLTLLVDGTPFTVTLTANPSAQTVVTAINAVISSKGYAYDEGGVVHVRTLSRVGSVEVTGTPSVALALGFDLRLGALRTYAGDVAGAGEGRINNLFGAVMPVPGESLNSESFVRALARLSANLDVLLSDGNRTTPQFVEWGTVTSIDDTSGNYSLVSITPNAPYVGLGVSNGLGSLRAGVTLVKAAIAPFFYLTAASGYYPSPHQAVGVVKAAFLSELTGAAPYANATSAAGPGNVFGLSLVKAGPYQIDEILGGRVVYRSGGFGAARVGDYVEIRPDANTTKLPWANNGIRWKVEAVIGNGLSLAPLSKAELTDAGLSGANEVQPIVSLNGTRGNTENFGGLYLWTGPTIDAPKLVVSPPMAPSAIGTVVWAAVPSSPRSRAHGEGMNNPALNILAQGFPHNDVIVTKGTMSLTVGTLTVSGMVIRKNGFRNDVSSTLTGLGSYTGYIILTTSGAATLATSAGTLLPGTGIPIAKVVSGAITHDLRIAGEVTEHVTVGGAYAMLPDIQTAIYYCALRAVDVTEIVVTYDQASPVGGWVTAGYPIMIRGENPSISLARNGSSPLLTSSDSQKVILKNLTLPVSDPKVGELFVSPSSTIFAVDCFDSITGDLVSMANLSTGVGGEVAIYGGQGTLSLFGATSTRVGDGSITVYLGTNATTVSLGGASTSTVVLGTLAVTLSISGASITVTGSAQASTLIGTTKVSTPVVEGYAGTLSLFGTTSTTVGTGSANTYVGVSNVGVYLGTNATLVAIGAVSTTVSGTLAVTQSISSSSATVTNANGTVSLVDGSAILTRGLRVGAAGAAPATGEAILSAKLTVPVIESGYVPAQSVSGVVIAFTVESFQMSLTDVAKFRTGDTVTDTLNADDHGVITGINYSTGWVTTDPGGLWTSWETGHTLTANQATIGVSPLTLRANTVGDGPVRVAPKDGPKTDTSPLFRVANDVAASVPVMDVTKDGFTLYENGSQYTSMELIERIWRRIARYGTVGSAGVQYFWRGNISAQVMGGCPNITKLTATKQVWDTTLKAGALLLTLQPSSNSDNLEAMRHATVEWYTMDRAWDRSTYPTQYKDTGGTNGTVSAVLLKSFHSISDRLFASLTSSDAVNATGITATMCLPTMGAGTVPAARITIYNAFGGSSTYWFVTTTTDSTLYMIPGGAGLPTPLPDVYLTPAAQTVWQNDGETAFLSIVGGTGPFTLSTPTGGANGHWITSSPTASRSVSWQPTAASFPSGATVQVTDANGKTATATITVNDTAAGADPVTDCCLCVVPGTPILLPDNRVVAVETLKVGDQVWTKPDSGVDVWGSFPIKAVNINKLPIVRVELEDGRILRVTPSHRFFSGGGWLMAYDLEPGEILDGSQPGVVKQIVDEKVTAVTVSITVAGARTYVSDGLLSHNISNPHCPGGLNAGC
jgi:hypothetical protein